MASAAWTSSKIAWSASSRAARTKRRAARLLVTAHRELESLALDRETAHYQQLLSLRYAEMVYYGMWFTPLREALDAFFTSSQRRVTGSVSLTLCKGNVNVASRHSPYSLYRTNLASFTMTGYNPKDAEGFINLFALPITVPQEPAEPQRQSQVRSEGQRPMTAAAANRKCGAAASNAAPTHPSTNSSAPGTSIAACCRRNSRSTAPGRAPSSPREFSRDEEGQKIVAALDEIALNASQSDPAWLNASKAEDVHHFVETALIEKLGALGAKLHTGRSRNEMVATEFRMYVRMPREMLRRALASLQRAIAAQAERNLDVPMPGTTHMQHAQPIAAFALASRARRSVSSRC